MYDISLISPQSIFLLQYLTNFLYFQPQLVEKAIIVDVSPVTTSPALSNMGEIFSAMKRVRFPPNIDLPQARILADKQLKVSIPEQVTRSFILMNLYKTPTGLWVNEYFGIPAVINEIRCFFFVHFGHYRIKWRSNVESLDCNFGKHIARFVGPQQLVTNAYTAPMLFIGGRKSDYLTWVSYSLVLNYLKWKWLFIDFHE